MTERPLCQCLPGTCQGGDTVADRTERPGVGLWEDAHGHPMHDADAALAWIAAAQPAPAQAVPLTPDQLADKCEAWLQGPDSFMCNNPVDAYEAGFRAAEAYYGITGDTTHG